MKEGASAAFSPGRHPDAGGAGRFSVVCVVFGFLVSGGGRTLQEDGDIRLVNMLRNTTSGEKSEKP